MISLFSEEFSKLASFIFYFYDFDKDGLISKEDIRVVLSYIPLKTKNSEISKKFREGEFKDQIESQEELHKLLEQIFKNSETINQMQFINVIEQMNSDIFLFILIFLLEKRPFSIKTLDEFEGRKNSGIIQPILTPTIARRMIASPNLNSKFSPSNTISKSPALLAKRLNQMGNNSLKNDNKNMLLKLAGKDPNQNAQKSALLKYTSKVNTIVQENPDENTDEGVSVNNVRVSRKQRLNLKEIENKKENIKQEYDNLPITPAVKLAFPNKSDNG